MLFTLDRTCRRRPLAFVVGLTHSAVNAQTGPNGRESRAVKFAGTALYVDDVRAVLDFHRRAFGFETKFFDESLQCGEVETGSESLTVASHQTGEMLMPGKYLRPEGGGQVSGVELAFVTPDVPAAFARAVGAGAVALAEPKVLPWGWTVAYVRSIEGTIIGLCTPPAA